MASKRAGSSVIAFALAFSAFACGGARSGGAQGAKVPLAPAGAYVEDDVAAGFGAYGSVLERWGRWSPDARYGVQWCPNRDQVAGYGLPFEPYRTGGHWDTSLEKPVYGAPPGTPYWVSDDAETWGEITMHHGYWVQRFVDRTGGARAADWCWIPGVSPTEARVVWRSGGGFVGWAPEPPSWVDDGGEGLYADFVWSFVMTGALLETVLDDQILASDAAQIAAEATTPFGGAHEHPFVRNGPHAATVSQAKRELAAYVRAHPEIPVGSTSAIARATAASGSASSGSGGSSAGSAAATSGSGPDAKSKAAKKSDDEPMPQASILVQTMMRDPMIGPIGVTPRFFRPVIAAPFEPATGAALESGGYRASSDSSSGGEHESGRHSAFSSILSSAGSAGASTGSVHSGSSSSSSSHSSGSSSSSHSSSASSHSSGSSSSSSTSSHSSARAPK